MTDENLRKRRRTVATAGRTQLPVKLQPRLLGKRKVSALTGNRRKCMLGLGLGYEKLLVRNRLNESPNHSLNSKG